MPFHAMLFRNDQTWYAEGATAKAAANASLALAHGVSTDDLDEEGVTLVRKGVFNIIVDDGEHVGVVVGPV